MAYSGPALNRTRRLLAALAIASLIGAGCSKAPARTDTDSGSGGTNAATHEEGLRFAQCIRDNGVKDFPDPTPDGPLVDTNRIPSANQPGGMSILNAAMQKCGELAQRVIGSQP
jgi:hypothetical protein